MKNNVVVLVWLAVFLLTICLGRLQAEDRPQWGEPFSRNMVSAETGLPDSFVPGKRDPRTGQIDLASTENVRWVARLGNTTYGSPSVAEGRVLIGTNNQQPRDPRCRGDRGVLMCFDEKTGEFLWQLIVPKIEDDRIRWSDWRLCGVSSTPAIENGRVYLVSNRCEVLCLDLGGMANGNDGPYRDEGRHMVPPGEAPLEPTDRDGDILWLLDMTEELGVQPHNASNCSIQIDGDLLYVCTSNGADWKHLEVLSPESPSMIVMNKHTGKLVAKDDFGMGPDITHGQWSSPCFGKVGEKMLGFFGSGTDYLYAFRMLDPKQTGDRPALPENVWRFNGHPLSQTQDYPAPDHQHDSNSYQVTAMPVFYKNRIYVPFTQEPFHRQNRRQGWLTCIDATKTGDVTRSALLWSYDKIRASCSTVAIADGLVYACGFDRGELHCLDAETGECYWVHDAGSEIHGSPLVADGKVYLGSTSTRFSILAAGKQLEVLSDVRMPNSIHSTVTAANGVLYIATDRHLYAVGK